MIKFIIGFVLGTCAGVVLTALMAANDNHVEITRCKDCMNYQSGECPMKYGFNDNAKFWLNSPYDYCSRAERRTDETD